MVTMKDIAFRAQVSIATVSYVINNTRPVSAEKTERILRAIKELNYVPNASARGLRAKKTNTIGLVISDITNPFYPDLAKGCQDVAQESGYTLMMFNTNDQENQLAEMVKQTREGKMDGLILASIMQSDIEIVKNLLLTPYPIVFAHRQLGELDIGSVTVDNFNGAEMGTKHLIDLGHKKIVFLDGIEDSPVNVERRNGYITAMHKSNLSEWTVDGQSKYESAYSVALSTLKLPTDQRPTAIFAGSDLMALGVIDAAKDLNLLIPEDLAVLGYDDLFFASSRAIQLSTVRVPRYEMGRVAVQNLLAKLNGKSDSKIKNTILQTNLIIRNSSGESIHKR